MQNSSDKLKQLFLYTPDRDFVKPYFEKYLTDIELCYTAQDADYALMISSTDIYDVSCGLNYNELAHLCENSIHYSREKEFEALCKANSLQPIILRCANVVCTGMTGRVRDLANMIYRGYYVNIAGNESQLSVIHAVDLPMIFKQLIDKPGIFNATDGSETTLNELAEALAWRLGQKRLFSIKPKLYKLLFGRKKYNLATTSLTFSAEKLRSRINYTPTLVVNYLKTHNYDESSL